MKNQHFNSLELRNCSQVRRNQDFKAAKKMTLNQPPLSIHWEKESVKFNPYQVHVII